MCSSSTRRTKKAFKYGSEFLFGCFHNLVTPSGVPIIGFSDLEVFFGSDGLHFFFLFFFFLLSSQTNVIVLLLLLFLFLGRRPFSALNASFTSPDFCCKHGEIADLGRVFASQILQLLCLCQQQLLHRSLLTPPPTGEPRKLDSSLSYPVEASCQLTFFLSSPRDVLCLFRCSVFVLFL